MAFWSRKLRGAKTRYHTHDLELLAIVEALQHWRPFILSARDAVKVVTDHKNLEYFLNSKQLSSRQARYAEKLAEFSIKLVYRAGKKNPANAPSRRPDYANNKEDVLAKRDMGKQLARQLKEAGLRSNKAQSIFHVSERTRAKLKGDTRDQKGHEEALARPLETGSQDKPLRKASEERTREVSEEAEHLSEPPRPTSYKLSAGDAKGTSRTKEGDAPRPVPEAFGEAATKESRKLTKLSEEGMALRNLKAPGESVIKKI